VSAAGKKFSARLNPLPAPVASPDSGLHLGVRGAVEHSQHFLGVVMVAVGAAVLTRADRVVEARLVDLLPDAWLRLLSSM